MKNAKLDPVVDAKSYKGIIMDEIEKTYQGLPETFYAHALFVPVRAKVFHLKMRFPYQDTVLRYFRLMREHGTLKCECIDRKRSLYVKL